MTIGIIGLGLMGGSFALALQAVQNELIFIGLDHNNANQERALELGLVDRIGSFEEIQACDVIVLAIPVDAIIATLQHFTNLKANQTIIDLGSTKEKIVRYTPPHLRSHLVAAHPMAGTEYSGPDAAIPDLYDGKVVVLCDIEQSGEIQRKRAEEIFSLLEMKMVYMDADEHDRHAAYISHLPHAISFALANSVLGQEDRASILALAGGGFRSMSRIAKSSPKMWRDVFAQNRGNLLRSIEVFEKELSHLKRAVEEEDFDQVERLIAEANRLHTIL